MREFDTISAISTAIGEGGISIVRVSGDKALSIINSVFKGKNPIPVTEKDNYKLRYGHIVDSQDTIIDEVIVSFMRGPKSYTAEDTVEINCHGGIIATNRVLELVIKAGARLAEPGEFTKRAFLNGRIDLSQAEAVIDIIRSKTELSMKSAVMQAGGKLSLMIKALRDRLITLIAHIEATVDYPEDDLEEVTALRASSELNDIVKDMDNAIENADQGKILREGISTVIVGKPNVGKSSLLNSLLMENRAIVTDIPGTTRDVIEEYINVGGIPIKIVDTAGIRETDDIVEKIGVQKSKEKIEEADLIILMLDTSRELTSEDKDIINFITGRKCIVLLNKSDLDSRIDYSALEGIAADYVINTSIISGYGINELKEAISKLFFNGKINSSDFLITNVRHKDALIAARNSCIMALNALRDTGAIDLASIDIRNAWYNLGHITGDTIEEDIINKIFSEFCLGK